ncbi:MAG: polysaccharide deacetylase family protein [Chloroflexota bacterium]
MKDQSRPAADHQPPRNVLATPIGAGALALLVVALVAAIAILPGLEPGPANPPTPACGTTSTPSACPPSPVPPTPSPTASAVPSFVRPTPTPAPTFMSYVVRAGDSLTSIARAFSTSPRSLAWWNRGTYPSLNPESEGYDPNHIEPGWTLVLIPGVIVDDANAPSPSPGSPTVAPTLVPSSTPGSTATAGGPATVITNGPRGTTQIALTFDMGGRLDPAVDIVQWLIDHGVRATLFPTGKAGTTTDQGKAALLLAATRPDLFEIANHSWDHPDFTTLTAAQMAGQLTSTETAIQALTGMTTKPWFRPPYGAWTYAVRAGVGAAGWPDLIMWDVDTIDWKNPADGGPAAADIVTKVLTKARGGSIVLMHLGGWHTLEALPEMLSGLQSKGLTPVTLSTMLGR